jgi:integrase
VEGETKLPTTDAGKRTIELLPLADQALKDQRSHTQLAGAEVFQNPLKPAAWQHDQQIRNQFRRILHQAGVRYRYPYQLRHTFASLSLSSGENIMWVAKQMGHKDWTVTARKYARWMKSAATDAGGKFNKLWG